MFTQLKYLIRGIGLNLDPQVSFFMTGSSRRRRRSATASFDDYREMALASGGQAIDVSKKQLPQATAIIRDTSTSALVRENKKKSKSQLISCSWNIVKQYYYYSIYFINTCSSFKHCILLHVTTTKTF